MQTCSARPEHCQAPSLHVAAVPDAEGAAGRGDEAGAVSSVGDEAGGAAPEAAAE